METKHELEMTIRTATLLKSVSQIVGVKDAMLAKLMFAECVMQFGELGKFIDSVQPQRR